MKTLIDGQVHELFLEDETDPTSACPDGCELLVEVVMMEKAEEQLAARAFSKSFWEQQRQDPPDKYLKSI